MTIPQRVKKTPRRRLLLLLLVAFGAVAMVGLVALGRWSDVDSGLCPPGVVSFFNPEPGEPRPFEGVKDDIWWGHRSMSWTPDGSHIVFNVPGDYRHLTGRALDAPPYGRVHVVALDGSSLVRFTTDDEFDISLSPVVSPDGSRIAYSAYRYVRGDTGGDSFERYFEIWTSSLDGSDRRILTDRAGFDLYPTWSPDGGRIGFVRQPQSHCYEVRGARREIYVMDADGSGARAVLESEDVAKDTPDVTNVYVGDHIVWSPDGQSLAFFIRDESVQDGVESSTVSLMTVGADGTSSKRVHTGDGDRLPGPPSWSPDGERIAFVESGEGVLKLYTIRRDGSGLQEVFALDRGQPARTLTVDSWSPDGSQILFQVGQVGSSAQTLHEVGSGGSGRRIVGVGGVRSPDGSRTVSETAVFDRALPYFYTEFTVHTQAADGSDVRVLAHWGRDEMPEVVRWAEQRHSADIASCSAGVVVSDPAGNPGLVRDCQALVQVVDRLGIQGLNWDTDTTIYAWDGVTVGGLPPRVLELSLPERGVLGNFPDNVPELGELRRLDLSGNALTGVLSGWLVSLPALEELDLSGNTLTGQIPPEIAELSRLRALDLSHNGLSSIPPELGNLKELEDLDLSFNLLVDSIPRELSGLSRLRILNLSHNKLTGPIPPELGNLKELEEIHLRRNSLAGPIPSELADLSSLREMDFEWNKLSGLFPSELSKLSSLERLAIGDNSKLTGCIPPELREASRQEYRHLDYCDE